MRPVTIVVIVVLLVIGSASVGFFARGAGFTPATSYTTTLTSTTTATSTATSARDSTETTTVTSTVMLMDTTTLRSSSGQLGPWNKTTSYSGHTAPSSCVTSLGYIYCVGGNGNATYFATISSNGVGLWNRGTDYPIAIQDESCIQSSNYVYCVGGVSGQSTDPYGGSPDVFYAPLSASGFGQWTKTTSYPYIAASPRCMTYSSTIFCIEDGLNGTNYTNSPKAYYAPLSANGVGSWAQSSAAKTTTAGCAAIGDVAYCFGGGNCAPIVNTDCYSPSYSSKLSSSGLGTWNRTTDLPTAGFAAYVTAGPFIFVLTEPVFYAQVSASGIGPWEATTNFPDPGQAGACASNGNYLYCTSATNSDVYFTQVGAPNPSAFVLRNPPPFPRADYLAPAWSGTGGCSVTVNGTFAGAPCFDRDIDNAVIFNCTVSAATPSGCKTTVVSPTNTAYNYDITIWYPRYNATVPNTNCAFLPSLGYKQPFYAWCISISPNSFIIAQQIAMQPPQP